MSIIEKLRAIPADYWDCDEDAELLTHEAPDCAIEAHLDGRICTHGLENDDGDPEHANCDVEAQLRELGPLTVWPWNRDSVSLTQVGHLAKHLFEEAEEWLCENTTLADPEGDPMLPKSVIDKHRGALQEVVRAICAEAAVWHCDRGEPVTLTPDEVIELMREHCQEWFEKDGS